MMHRIARASAVALLLAGVGTALTAETVNIARDIAVKRLILNGQSIAIRRIQDTDHRLTGDYARTSRACPPDCIQPMQLAPGIETLGELEVIAFLEVFVAKGDALLIDTRLPDRFAGGTVPGAVNLPWAALNADTVQRKAILRALGAVETNGDWDFTDVITLALFCEGPWSDRAARAAKALIDLGYPSEKLTYFRGGMQSWHTLGLMTTAQAQQ